MGYATLTDLSNCGLPASALASVSNTVKQAALDDFSAYADTYCGDKYTVPFQVPYDRTLVRAICHLAAEDLMAIRGYNPSDPTDTVIATRAAQAREWLVRVANGQARLNIVQGTPESLQPDVYTNVSRGFGDTENDGGTDDPSVIVGG